MTTTGRNYHQHLDLTDALCGKCVVIRLVIIDHEDDRNSWNTMNCSALTCFMLINVVGEKGLIQGVPPWSHWGTIVFSLYLSLPGCGN